MNLDRMRRSALIVLCTSILAGLAAAPAGAAPTPMTATGEYARTAPFIDGTIYDIQCGAAAPGAVTTRIDSCKLIDPRGSGYGAPAVASDGATANTSYLVAIPTYQWHLCWTASATYGDGSSQSTTGCTGVSPYAGAGVSTS